MCTHCAALRAQRLLVGSDRFPPPEYKLLSPSTRLAHKTACSSSYCTHLVSHLVPRQLLKIWYDSFLRFCIQLEKAHSAEPTTFRGSCAFEFAPSPLHLFQISRQLQCCSIFLSMRQQDKLGCFVISIRNSDTHRTAV